MSIRMRDMDTGTIYTPAEPTADTDHPLFSELAVTADAARVAEEALTTAQGYLTAAEADAEALRTAYEAAEAQAEAWRLTVESAEQVLDVMRETLAEIESAVYGL